MLFTLIGRWKCLVKKNQVFTRSLWSTGVCCSCLRYDRQSSPSAGIYARTGMMGTLVRFTGRDRRRGGWTKRRETCPQEGRWPTFSGQVSLSLFYFIKYFSFFLSFLPSRVIHKSSWSFVSAIRRKEAQIMVTSLISWPRLITHITQFVTYCAVSGIQRLIFFF